MRLAAIDIGSNAARLLIVDAHPYGLDGIDFTKINLLRVPLRLGFDVFENGSISKEKQHMMVHTLTAFGHLMKAYQVDHYRACATSAMRDAKNGKSIINEIFKKTNISIEIINGQEEANLIYETHIAENLGKSKSYLYIDVGGGSTELTLFSKDKIINKESFNIGTIRLLKNQVGADSWQGLKRFIKSNIKGLGAIHAIGSGGNINKVFSLSKKKEGQALSIEMLKKYHDEFSKLTITERMHEYGFREDRADVIVPALEIYLFILKQADIQNILVPKIGVADGIVRKLYQQHSQ